MSERFTSARVPDAGIQVLLGTEERWGSWLEIEAALALTQADFGMIPRDSAEAISSACRIDRLDLSRIRDGIARTSHPLMPLIVELSRVVGEPHADAPGGIAALRCTRRWRRGYLRFFGRPGA